MRGGGREGRVGRKGIGRVENGVGKSRAKSGGGGGGGGGLRGNNDVPNVTTMTSYPTATTGRRRGLQKGSPESVSSTSSLAPFLTSKTRFQEDAAIEHHSPGPKYLLPSSFGKGRAPALRPEQRRQHALPPALRKITTPVATPAPMVPDPVYPDTPDADLNTRAPVRVFDVYSCCRYPRYPGDKGGGSSDVVSSYWERRASDGGGGGGNHNHNHNHNHSHSGRTRSEPPTAAKKETSVPVEKRKRRTSAGSGRRRKTGRGAARPGGIYDGDGSAGDIFITKLQLRAPSSRGSSVASVVQPAGSGGSAGRRRRRGAPSNRPNPRPRQ